MHFNLRTIRFNFDPLRFLIDIVIYILHAFIHTHSRARGRSHSCISHVRPRRLLAYRTAMLNPVWYIIRRHVRDRQTSSEAHQTLCNLQALAVQKVVVFSLCISLVPRPHPPRKSTKSSGVFSLCIGPFIHR